MPRKLLPSRLHDPEEWAMNIGTISERPALAAIVGRVVGIWTNAELQMAILLSILLKADSEAAVAVYLVLRRSTPRYEALAAAANMTLNDRDKELFAAVMIVYQAAEKERNAVAHGIFGAHDRLPDSLLWVEALDSVKFTLEMLRKVDASGSLPPLSEHRALAAKTYHYTDKDLESVYAQLKEAVKITFDFNVYLREPTGVSRDQQYGRLCSQAPIARALHDLRQRAQKNTKPAPQKPPAKSPPQKAMKGKYRPGLRLVKSYAWRTSQGASE